MTRAELIAEYVATSPYPASPDPAVEDANFSAWVTDLKLAGYLTETAGDFEKTAAWPGGPASS